ncbi:MAG: NAD(P) transhydrogenase subunit alpha, partial [Caulobacteraceae bacterium]|nr:NAD(P) transhydrogenase subunit alpha [Caulobacteraceae bacterium]
MPTIAVTKERRAGETRVAATPESVKKLIASGFAVTVEAGAGVSAACTDAEYAEAGAKIVKTAKDAASAADVLLKVRAPETDEIAALKPGALVVALLNPHQDRAAVDALAARGASAFAMEFVPRITRAQVMDALSSQANLAGYRAVIEAAFAYGKGFPMMMTAAGTVAAAKVFVMGAGVAGLQAIATARRLGAVVTATDVRPAAKEQVESLGAKFVELDVGHEEAQDTGGYAKELAEDHIRREIELIRERAARSDVIVTTALIPGRPAPVLLPEETVQAMHPGAVIVDLAA